MTTTIRVSVPETADWCAVVTMIPRPIGDMAPLEPYHYTVTPGSEQTFAIHDGLDMKVEEQKSSAS